MAYRRCSIVALWLALVSCSDSKRGVGPPGVGTGGVGGGAAGAAGASSAGGGAGRAACTGFQVTGSLDGAAVDTTLVSGASVDSGWNGTDCEYRILLEHGGLLSLAGSAAAPPSAGDPVSGSGYLATPTDSELGGVHLTAGLATFAYLESSEPITLANLARVGSCPGTAIAGSLTVCVADTFAGTTACGGNEVQVTGTLDGSAIDQSFVSSSGFWLEGAAGSTVPRVARVGLDSDGALWLHDFGGTLSGHFAFPTASPQLGQVLCVGNASVTETNDAREVTLSSLSRGGTLPGDAVSGTLELTRCQ